MIGRYICIVNLCIRDSFYTNFFNVEKVLDDSGKPMKDKDGKEIKKLTTLGITLTVIFSIIIVMTVALMIYRNRDIFKKKS